MLLKFAFSIRQKIFSDRVFSLMCDCRFLIKCTFANLRGFIVKCCGKVLQNGSRKLLVGNSVKWLMYSGSAVILSEQSLSEDEAGFYHNPFFPNVSAIGFVPYWKFLNPPVGRDTYLRLQKDSRLILGPNTLICKGTYISVWPGKTIEIGMGTIIGHECYINSKSGLKIGSNSMIGQGTRVMDYDGHPIFQEGLVEPIDRYGGATAPITIGDNVWIGFGAVIMKGVNIGDGAIVATNSWVTQDVKPNSLVAGSPARLIQENISWKRF